MIIKTLWVEYDPDLMPNVVLAVDEYLHDENPNYWSEHFEEEVSKAEEHGYPWRVMDVEVREDDLLAAFKSTLLRGKLRASDE